MGDDKESHPPAMGEASEDLAEAYENLQGEDRAPEEKQPVPPPPADGDGNNRQEGKSGYPTRIAFSRTEITAPPKKGLSGRKWSSRRLGLSRKDSLEYDSNQVKGVTITHASYGVSLSIYCFVSHHS
jgi:hypothetical protein